MCINFIQNKNNQSGISLVELIIFIVILSVALTGITLIYITTIRYSADPMMRIRSIELAQSTLEEILLKAYDENTPVGGGCVDNMASTRCTPASKPDATSSTTALLGDEEGNTNRSIYNDVDDYHNKLYCGDGVVAANTACPDLTCQDMLDGSGTDISAQYSGYAVCIKLSFAGGAGTEINNLTLGTINDVLANDAKRIDVIVSDPLNSRISLSAYRLNF